MKDVTAALREMGSRADERLLPDPQTLREQVAPASRRRRRVRAGAWAVAAAALAVVLGVGVPALDGDRSAPAPVEQPRPDRRAPAPSPTSDVETGPYPADQGWEEIPFGRGVGWQALAHRGGSYVAAADTSTAEFLGDAATASGEVPIWWSVDGRTWTRVADGSGPATDNVWTVLATDAGFVALAVEPRGGTTAWLSDDGRTWRSSGSVPDGFRPYALVETDLGLVAWGRGRVWVSGDAARTWRAADGGPIWPRTRYTWNPCWVEQTETGLEALVIREGGGPDGTPVRWRSEDGLTWQLVGDVAASRPALLCAEHDDDDHRVTGAAGTVAIEPYADRYARSIFFQPTERGQ